MHKKRLSEKMAFFIGHALIRVGVPHHQDFLIPFIPIQPFAHLRE